MARSRRLYEELRYQADSGSFAVEVVAGLSSGTADTDDPDVRKELTRELIGLGTMNDGEEPRIHSQPDFQPGGQYWALSERVSPGQSARNADR